MPVDHPVLWRVAWMGLIAVLVVLGFLAGALLRHPHVESPPALVKLASSGVLPLLATNEPPDPPPASMPDSPDRVADARQRRATHLAEMFAEAGVAYPAAEIYLRAFKLEGQLELWARSHDQAAFRLVHTYPILCASGRLGPKRREGDQQVPEGFYLVDRFNPRSLFHLSLGLNYPSASDRLLTTDPAHPGSDVYIHGATVSAGCLAMGDTSAEEIYLAAWDARTPNNNGPTVHIFPCRMNESNWHDLLVPASTGQPELAALWNSLRTGYRQFEDTHQLPTIQVDTLGHYQVH